MHHWHCVDFFWPHCSVSCENLRSPLQVPVRDHLILLIAKASSLYCPLMLCCADLMSRFSNRRQLILKRFIERWLDSETWYNPGYIFLIPLNWLEWILQIHACKTNKASLQEAQKNDISRCLGLLPKRFPETRVQNVATEIATLL